jgi:hypothetical protein
MAEVIFYGFNRSLKVRTMRDSSLTPIEDKAGRVVQKLRERKDTGTKPMKAAPKNAKTGGQRQYHAAEPEEPNFASL